MIRKIIFFFIIVGLFVRTYVLADIPFHDWDEGMYAEIASAINEDNSLILKFNDQYWFDKPFLSYFLLALVFKLPGAPEFWGRTLMMAIASIVLLMIYLLGRRIYDIFFKRQIVSAGLKEKEFIYMIPVLVLISNVSFLDRATLLNTDTLLVLSWLGYFLFRSHYKTKVFFLCVGVWSKSIVGFFPAIIEIFLVRKKDLTIKNFLKLTILVLAPLVWHIANYLTFGSEFIKAHFVDQLVRRLYIPLELHYAGKLFYPYLIWKNMNVISIIIFFGLFLFLLNIFYNRGKFKFKNIKTTISKIISDNNKFWFFSAYYFPVAVIIFLTLSITKLDWYYVWFGPFLSIGAGVVYLYFEKKIIRIIIFTVITIWSVINFIPQTYAFRQLELKYTKPERTAVAQCIAGLKPGKLGALVDEKERRAKQVIEAANVASSSTFYWGISVSFAYYSSRDVDYYYDIASFAENINKYPYIILAGADRKTNKDIDVKLADLQPIKNCWIGDWQVYKKP